MGCQRKCKCKKQLLYVDAPTAEVYLQFKENLSSEVLDGFEVRRFVETDWITVRGGIASRIPLRPIIVTTDSSARRLMELAKFADQFKAIWSMCAVGGAFITENMKQLYYDEPWGHFWVTAYIGKVQDAVTVTRPVLGIEASAIGKNLCVNGGSTVVTNVLKNDGAQMGIVMNRKFTDKEIPALKLASDEKRLYVTYWGMAEIQQAAEENNWTTLINADGNYEVISSFGSLAFNQMVDPAFATQAAGIYVDPQTRFCDLVRGKVTAQAFNRTYAHEYL